MSVTLSPSPAASPVPAAAPPLCARIANAAPLLHLYAGAAFWLFVALALGLVNSLKFHNPRFLADCAFLSYGRVQAAHNIALLYGFGVPAALGVGFWILTQLGRTPLAAPGLNLIGSHLWNLTVIVGVIAVMCGDTTGFADFEMPSYCAHVLFVAYLLMGISGALTFHRRQTEGLYPSQWFILGALFWFPWIFSTATILLLEMPGRGVLQPCVAWWFSHNLTNIFLGFSGLASTFYFIPKLLGRPLHSYHLATLSFWGLALFGSWGGIPAGAPLPAWITSLSVVGTVLTTVPILALVMNFSETMRNATKPASITFCLTMGALIFWVVASAQQIIGVLPNVSNVTDFTFFGVAQKELFQLGFFALTIFGALYYIIPSLLGLGDDAWCPRLRKMHCVFFVAGIVISYLSLLGGGIAAGLSLANLQNSFADAMKANLMGLRASTLGDLFMLIGTICFLGNFAQLMLRIGFAACCAKKEAA
jgi:cytochrome c oxidase cbb3-type subunit 1